jgi:hypothetical protein
MDLIAVRTFIGLIRMGGLIVALSVYGLFGLPAPGRLSWREMVVGGGLVLASGVIRPLAVATGLMLIKPRGRYHDVVGTAAFNYLLWVPLFRASIMGADADDIVRDVVPLMFLFLPVFLMPVGDSGRRVLILGMAMVGVAFALRWWWPGLAFRQVGRAVLPEGRRLPAQQSGGSVRRRLASSGGTAKAGTQARIAFPRPDASAVRCRRRYGRRSGRCCPSRGARHGSTGDWGIRRIAGAAEAAAGDDAADRSGGIRHSG